MDGEEKKGEARKLCVGPPSWGFKRRISRSNKVTGWMRAIDDKIENAAVVESGLEINLSDLDGLNENLFRKYLGKHYDKSGWDIRLNGTWPNLKFLPKDWTGVELDEQDDLD